MKSFLLIRKILLIRIQKFKFHAEIEDPDFYEKLFSKKEFHKHQYKIEKRKMEDICPQTSETREFKLMPHQEFLKELYFTKYSL